MACSFLSSYRFPREDAPWARPRVSLGQVRRECEQAAEKSPSAGVRRPRPQAQRTWHFELRGAATRRGLSEDDASPADQLSSRLATPRGRRSTRTAGRRLASGPLLRKSRGGWDVVLTP